MAGNSSRPNLVQFVSVEATLRQIGVLSTGFAANTLTVWLISRSIAFFEGQKRQSSRRKLGASPQDRPAVSTLFPSRAHSFCLRQPGFAQPGAGYMSTVLRVGGVVMRIALAFRLCLLSFAATAARRAQTDKPQLPQIETPAPPAQSPNLRENYRSRLNENVVTIMAASP